ncbi:MAG: hypothetical protein WC889_11335 [Myxococcota bacterium]
MSTKRKVWLFFFCLGYVQVIVWLNLHGRFLEQMKAWSGQDHLHNFLFLMLSLYFFFNLVFVPFSIIQSLRHIFSNKLLNWKRKIGWSLGLVFGPMGSGIALYWNTYGAQDTTETAKRLDLAKEEPESAKRFKYDPGFLLKRFSIVIWLMIIMVVLASSLMLSMVPIKIVIISFVFWVFFLLVIRYLFIRKTREVGEWEVSLGDDGLLLKAGELSHFTRYRDIKHVKVYPEDSFFFPRTVRVKDIGSMISVFEHEEFIRQLKLRLGPESVVEYHQGRFP